VAGIYLHSMFNSPEALQQIIAWADTDVDEAETYTRQLEHKLDRPAGACMHMYTGRKHIHL
jgi:adenosylcobyric acid synthase